ncbi:MAG TPA: hemolytic protein HlpA-like protein [Cyanobacteria bacterium UBA11367]|nr:hemolytic protein HlpA-like protein [Cyanobacteria bacterium UBA11367]HBE36378.1 hemolytic protein HlpA-like protein [Cyanobacteria bacterium UBA11368]
MSLVTPVALFIFNRPDLTEIVFEQIRSAKPKKLLVVADGPRFPQEAEKCEKARKIIERVDWHCEVLTNFSEKNIGCGIRVSTGLDWVFSEVEEAIILEDDCLPTASFFYFCQTLLEYYKHDQRIMHISGNNFQLGKSRTEYSYYFSRYPHSWGWASWRRAWKYFDQGMKNYTDFKKANVIKLICENPYEQNYWTSIFDRMFEGVSDTWDYQWFYACLAQNGLSILPNSNLVSNIGFRSDATHTCGESPWERLPTSDIWEIEHPPFIIRHREADDYTFDYLFGGKFMKENDRLPAKIRKRLSIVKRKIKSWL